MDVYEAMRKRCSVRSFRDKPIEEDKLLRVLEAGRISPSARNDQARKFVVVRDAKLRAALAASAEQPFIGQAPVVIAVVATEPNRKMHCGVESGPVDCAIAMDHMTLAAMAEGLGTCWIGHFDQDACRKVLGVPESAMIIDLLPMGYPAPGADAPKTRPRKPMDQVVCHDRFNA
jgi:nitroreductase